MSNFFEVSGLRTCAQDALARGWAILTCEPHDKSPWAKYSPYAVNSATRNPDIALKAWTDCTEANYGIACGASGITVVDCDLGLNSIEEFEAWRQEHNLPETYAVISGREKFGMHLYFAGVVKTQPFKIGKVSGELKGKGAYVLGAGSNHPSGKKYQIIKDVTLAPLPDVFKSGSIKPQLVYSQDGDVIGYVENGSFVPIVLDIADASVQNYARGVYWAGSIEDNQLVWGCSNISKFLEGHGLTLAKILPFISSIIVKGPCSLCKEETGYSATSRTKAQELAKYFNDGSARCTQCWEKEQAVKAEADKIAAEQAAIAQQQALAAKEQELANYREMLILKHGKDLVTEHLCPSCADGWLVVKIGAQQIPFLGCSRYNYFRSSSCRYTSSIPSESVAELLPIFQKRLEAQMAKA